MPTNDVIRVLLVDDDVDDRVMFCDLLAQVNGKNFKIEWAPSYERGKAALAAGNSDVCFVDYRLGPQTGLDLLQSAIADGCSIPIILLTGYGEHEVDLKAMESGAADYLVKDEVTPYLLERSIRYALHRAQAVQSILEREAQILVQDRLASVGLLASSLAHEIGTPLGVIRGRAEYLELQLRGDPNVKKNVEIIISQIDRVSKLIRSLLNLARGSQIKKIVKIDLHGVVSEVIELMAHEFRRLGIKVVNELEAQETDQVKAENGPLHQVVLNLLVNSVHAIESAQKMGRMDHFVRLAAEERGDNVVLLVEDTGCGIPEKNLKHLFKPFFTTKEIGVGTGLGLATSYRIVESWGGSIEVSSTEGVGTTFRIIIPKF